MVTGLRNIWIGIREAGVHTVHTERLKRNIRSSNTAWLLIVVIQIASLVSHIAHHLPKSSFLTSIFIAGLMLVHLMARRGYVDLSRITAIALVNYNTVIMAVFMGPETRVIDFLLLAALMPLYLFETDNKRLIFAGIVISILPYAGYQYAIPYLQSYALPVAEQLGMAQTTTWVMVFSLSVLLYLIYHKNADYEKEAHETQGQLIEQKKLYERILEQIPIDIVTFDKQLKYTYINSAAIKDPEVRQWMIGKGNQDYFKERNLDLAPAIERDRMLHEAMAKGEKIETEESFVNRHGELTVSIKGASPVYGDDKKELLCLIGYSLDVTTMKEAERQVRAYATELERKNADLQHFVNATSHDLKSPLRNIASYLQLLERKNKGKLDEDSLSLMSYTVTAVKQLNQLINDIYQYSVADRSEKPFEITDLNVVLAKTLKDLQPVIQQKGALVQHMQLPQLKLAPSHMGMIFTNLIGNALKYNTSAHPMVNIACSETPTDYLISVADNGIGIAKEYNKKVFEIFRRLHTSEAYEGTGVGLAICKKITETYGGKIWVESEEGKGSTFFFSLSKSLVATNIAQIQKLPPYNEYASTGT